jgi:hypothetical protein
MDEKKLDIDVTDKDMIISKDPLEEVKDIGELVGTFPWL